MTLKDSQELGIHQARIDKRNLRYGFSRSEDSIRVVCGGDPFSVEAYKKEFAAFVPYFVFLPMQEAVRNALRH